MQKLNWLVPLFCSTPGQVHVKREQCVTNVGIRCQDNRSPREHRGLTGEHSWLDSQNSRWSWMALTLTDGSGCKGLQQVVQCPGK